MALLRLQKVKKSFFGLKGEEIEVLTNIDLEVKQGEFVCLLGPSGCGKSTLLNIVAGLLLPDAGAVMVDEQPVGAGRVGMVFQEGGLFPWLTVLDNVAFGLRIKGMGKKDARAKAREYLRRVHLEEFAFIYPHQLSGGMRQRVAIARTLAMDPPFLLMDEPFSALDTRTRTLLQQELLHIWQQTRKGILFVTHSIEEALLLADRVVVLSGRPARIKQEVTLPFPRPRDLRRPPFVFWEEELKNLFGEERDGQEYSQAFYDRALSQTAVLPAARPFVGRSV